MRVNPKVEPVRLAGGYGAVAAQETPAQELRRMAMTAMLFEPNFYSSGDSVAKAMAELVPMVEPDEMVDIVLDSRFKQLLRHTPLFLIVEMLKYPQHKKNVANLIKKVVTRPDMACDLVALYFRDGRRPLAAQLKKGLAAAVAKFDSYQLKKWEKKGSAIKLRDVIFMTHPKPQDTEAFRDFIAGKLPAPYTWETLLSSGMDKHKAWTDLLVNRRLPVLAFIRNLRNLEESVDHELIKDYFEYVSPGYLLPSHFLSAVKAAPRFFNEIEKLMLKSLERFPKLKGKTIFVIDVSGSMKYSKISKKSNRSRLEVAIAQAIAAASVCENVVMYATAGNDGNRQHATKLIPSYRGFALMDTILNAADELGGGGIFTRQALEYIREREPGEVERIIVFSDSQDCDYPDRRIPKPFGNKNYIVDCSSERYGINYKGVWTAEISGWSDRFLEFIAAHEGMSLQQINEDIPVHHIEDFDWS